MRTDSTSLKRDDYLRIVYSEDRRPRSDYAVRLAQLLAGRYYGGPGRLLDIGCGRGDMLSAFSKCGFDVAGVDISPAVAELCAPFEAVSRDIATDALPFPPGSFDGVFSKSVIEHMHDPMPLLHAAFEALKPGGVAVVMTPSWLHHAWGPFYLDHTHVTPFTAPSLEDVLRFAQFEDIEVTHFRQLPFLWRHRYLLPAVWAFSKLPLPYRPMYRVAVDWPASVNKLIRFSKEVMLLGVGRKPV